MITDMQKKVCNQSFLELKLVTKSQNISTFAALILPSLLIYFS